MVKRHPGAGIAHDGADFLAHQRTIAVHLTINAGWFVSPERAFLNAGEGICKQLPAFAAGHLSFFMMLAAVHFKHYPERMFFPVQPRHFFITSRESRVQSRESN